MNQSSAQPLVKKWRRRRRRMRAGEKATKYLGNAQGVFGGVLHQLGDLAIIGDFVLGFGENVGEEHVVALDGVARTGAKGRAADAQGAAGGQHAARHQAHGGEGGDSETMTGGVRGREDGENGGAMAPQGRSARGEGRGEARGRDARAAQRSGRAEQRSWQPPLYVP